MLSTEDFIRKYDGYTDEQLYHILSQAADYSPEAQEALNIVIEKKGGRERLTHHVTNRRKIVDETNRIGNEITKMLRNGVDPDFIRSMMASQILEPEEVKTIVEKAIAAGEKEKKDQKITPRTIIGSILGSILAILVGGAASALAFKYLPVRMPVIILLLLLVGLALLCYAIIRACARQSGRNLIVLIATFIAIVLSLALGSLAADLFFLIQ